MIILGVDTAIRTTGYGVIEMTSLQKGRIIDCGIIKNSTKMLHSECLRRIAGGIRELITLHKIEIVSMEDAFLGQNIKTAMILSLARGAVITTAAEANLSIFTYAPTTVKKAVFGNGKATKEQMAFIISSLYGIKISDIPLDATDAVGMAMCHAQQLFRTHLKTQITPRPI